MASVSALDAIDREVAALPDGAAWVRGSLLKRLVKALIRDRARGGANVDELPTDKGRFFNAQAGGTAETPAQFSLYDASTTTGGVTTHKIGVRFGCVACYRSAADLKPWPDVFTSDEEYKYEFEVTADGCVWIKAHNDTSGNFYQVDTLTCDKGTTTPANDDESGYLTLGAWSLADDKLTILSGEGASGVGNQMYNFAGYSSFWAPA